MKVLIAGDLVTQNRVRERVTGNNYNDLLAELRPYTAQSDYAILNLETTIEDPLVHFRPIQKVGPHISAPVETLDMIKSAGFHCVSLANNHILDYGSEALRHTIRSLEDRGLEYVGAGEDLADASKVLVKQQGGTRLAIVNICESEFSIAGENTPGAYPMDLVKNLKQIQWAKENADYVLVIVHGGIELYPLPSPRMKELYRTFVDLGADAVVNHHQHCHSGYEVYKEKPIFYGLGNLLSDRIKYPNLLWYYGFFVRLSFGSEIAFDIVPYSQCLYDIKVSVLSGQSKMAFMDEVRQLNEQIADDAVLGSKYRALIKRKYPQVLFRLSPLRGRLFGFLTYKRWLPSMISKNKALMFSEYLSCESHRDLARNILSKYISDDKN